MHKTNLKRLLSIVCVLVLSFSLCVPSFASGQEYISNTSGFWDQFLLGLSGGTPVFDPFGLSSSASGVIRSLSANTCSESEDGHHHANTLISGSTGSDDVGLYGMATCIYCGDQFKVYSNDLSSSYNDAVSSFPANNIDSSGCSSFAITGWLYRLADGGGQILSYDTAKPAVSAFSDKSYTGHVKCSAEFTVPVSGVYTITLPSWSFTSTGSNFISKCYYHIYQSNATQTGWVTTNQVTYTSSQTSSVVETKYFDSTLKYQIHCYSMASGSNFTLFSVYSDYGICTFSTSAPVVLSGVQMISGGVSSTVNSRPTSITGGNYGIVGDNGTISNVSNTTIVDETNNLFYNPSTSESSTILSWTYDYSDRSYNLTLESGDTVTVTYGDEYITINEGDTVNNYYYIIQTPVDPEPSPSACSHEWEVTSSVSPTCTAPGKTVSTCSVCSETKTENVPALGHVWSVLRTVLTEYDENGELVQAGYTIYECERCGEQYKDVDGVGPPSGSGSGSGSSGDDDGESLWDKIGEFFGSIFGGLLELVGGFISSILDGLIALVESVIEKLGGLLDIFGSFGEALKVIWSWLPDEIVTVLVAGVSIFVLVGVLKIFL